MENFKLSTKQMLSQVGGYFRLNYPHILCALGLSILLTYIMWTGLDTWMAEWFLAKIGICISSVEVEEWNYYFAIICFGISVALMAMGLIVMRHYRIYHTNRVVYRDEPAEDVPIAAELPLLAEEAEEDDEAEVDVDVEVDEEEDLEEAQVYYSGEEDSSKSD